MELDNELERLELRFNQLWPVNRSITGPGFRESLEILQHDIPLNIQSVNSGVQVFDWQIPPDWRIHEAELTGPDGEVYASLNESNLSVVNYSEPVDQRLTLDQLDQHLYTLPEQPEATPYVTSYYERNWGFCIPHSVYNSLPKGEYHAYIDSELDDNGELNYGHTILEGKSDREVLLSTYLCHPSLANNELSGPLVMTSLYNRISSWDNRKFTYRFVVVPETIGSVAYLSKYGRKLKENLLAGVVLTCLGGPKENLSYKKTRREDALIDKVVKHYNKHMDSNFRFRPFDVGGSDERQYCSPGFNLPVGQFARTVSNEYEEYHTSMDNKEFLQIDSLIRSANEIERVLRTIEYAGYYVNQSPYGEPMMSKRGIYHKINTPKDGKKDLVKIMMRILNYSDGSHSIVDIAENFDMAVDEMQVAINKLCDNGLLEAKEYIPNDHCDVETLLD
jgi:aminopeptidase-like protein